MLFPTLVNKLKQLGITLENKEVIIKYENLRTKKLSKLPLEIIYRMKTVYNYSLELLDGTEFDIDKLTLQIEENGSYGSSPASTAFLLSKRFNEKSYMYLNDLLEKFGYIPDFYPFPEFERSWVISNFFKLGLVDEFKQELLPHVKFLEKIWSDKGVGFSKYFGVVDLDITSTIYRILSYFNFNHDLKVFKNFEDDEGFYCYLGESESSISHIANFIDCLENQSKSEERDRLYNKALNYLKGTLLNNLNDKWNTSHYYTLSRISIYGDKDLSEFKEKVLSKLLTEQNSNGSWGKQNGDPEETSWALISLNKILGDQRFYELDNTRKAYEYLNLCKINQRSNWISKVLYCPINIRNSVIFLTLYRLNKFYEK